MKVGVLYSRSNAHPGLLADFSDGIKAAITHAQNEKEIQIFNEIVGFGGVEKEIYEKAEKLLTFENVDMLVAYIDIRVLSMLEPLMLSTGKLLIVVNTGANYPQNWVPQENIIYLTQQHSFLCWLTGVEAAASGNKTAVIASDFYDCGYLHLAAMTNGYASREGKVVYNYINNDKFNEEFQITPLLEFLKSNNEITDLLCIFDEKPALLFYDRIRELLGSSPLRLFVSPMMLQPACTDALKNDFDVMGYLSFDPCSSSAASVTYQDGFKNLSGRSASIFSLQGWELGLILNNIRQSCEANYKDGMRIRDQLVKTHITSPRGELILDVETNYFLAPVYNAKYSRTEGELKISAQGYQTEEWEKFVAKKLMGQSSGWTNTYLCY